ncbi:MAG: ComF family protein [Verrucomicrobia bacterium]|nr:ComF family protein [Verrucomicrobiota bacterium]
MVRGLFYPAECAVCAAALDPAATASALCEACGAELRPLRRPFCGRCNLPFEGDITADFRCAHCAELAFHFERAVCGCRLSGVARECIHAFKYRRALWLGAELVALLSAAARERVRWAEVDVVVPVPLFGARQREREFNQADWLARRLVRALGGRVCAGNLIRLRDTAQQALLSPSERRENVRDAFAVRRPAVFTGRRVAVVDDVFTTGATTDECARVLRTAGARSVLVLTVARG